MARQISTKIPKVTTADVGNALWYWKSAPASASVQSRQSQKKIGTVATLGIPEENKSSLGIIRLRVIGHRFDR